MMDRFRDQSVDQARTNFLDHVRRVEFYGVDLHSAEVRLDVDDSFTGQVFQSQFEVFC